MPIRYRWRKTIMRLFSYMTISLLTIFFLAASVLAQAPSTGAQLSGTILDPNGAVVPGATVTLHSDTTGIARSAVSDGSGQYQFLLVPTGQYTVSVQAAGFG